MKDFGFILVQSTHLGQWMTLKEGSLPQNQDKLGPIIQVLTIVTH